MFIRKLFKIISVTLAAVLLIASAAVTVFAEPQEGEQQNESEYIDITDPPTEPDTEQTQEQTQEETQEETQEQTQEETQEQTQEETEPNTTQAQQETTSEPEQTQEQTEYVQSQTEDSTYDDMLPTVDKDSLQLPTAVGSHIENPTVNMTAGIVSWICVAVGVIVIAAVLLSTKSNERKNGGKQRYGRGDKITQRKPPVEY